MFIIGLFPGPLVLRFPLALSAPRFGLPLLGRLLSLGILNLGLPLWLLSLWRLPLWLMSLWLLPLLLHSLLLVPLHLGAPPIFLLSLTSQFLSLVRRMRPIVLDAIGSLPFPISIRVPALPVLLKASMRNPFIAPRVAVPIALPVVSSPARVDIVVETWNTAIIHPTPVVIARAVPTAFPGTPPPPVPEKQVYIDFGNDVHIARIRQHDHIRRGLKYNRWRQRNSDADIHLRRCRNGNDKRHRQKNCPP